MTVKQDKTGKWKVEIDRDGMPRTRKTFSYKQQAEEYEREYLKTYQSPLKIIITDTRTLNELAKIWFKYHGMNLSDGERRFKCLLDISFALKNPVGAQLTAEMFVDYRFKRLKAGISEKTLNNHHCYLLSMFNKLHKLRIIDYKNPLEDIDFIKIHERQLSYLSRLQIEHLLKVIETGSDNQSTWYVANLCVRTGARWGEAEQLRLKQLHAGRITYEFTKSKHTRTIPVEEVFYQKLLNFAKNKNPEDRIFTNCIGAFRRAVVRANIDLPRGQNSHILRHSFASHFIMGGGNILSLQKILGHSDISMTMRYAHLSPDHLQDAVRLNPIATPTTP
jgi:integrase